MNHNQNYGGGIQWIQHHAAGGLKNNATQLLVHEQQQLEVNEILDSNDAVNAAECDDDEDDDDDDDDVEYLDDDDATADLDQMAAENLMFMARDGQMVSEFIATHDNSDTVVVNAGDALVQTALVVAPDAFDADVFDEDAPQMVTEEVITDDWVQHQGEERVEIPATQIDISNSSQVLLDMVQDEYTALRPYPCDFCSRRFRKKASLNNHMIAHQNDRPHLCKLCGARFSRRAELINHFKAHAEQQFADETVQTLDVKFDTQKRQLDDHYYEQEWSESTTTATTLTSPQQQMNAELQFEEQVTPEVLQLEHTNSANNTSASTTSATTTTTATTRGRISRLKPKEETQYVLMEQKLPVVEMDYIECDELQASTAAVKLTQDQPIEPQPRFPVIDYAKPFVCQQCGLSFAREKALSSHAKNHRVDSPFECNQCNELFWDNNSLQEHQKTHRFEESNSEYDPAEAGDTQSESEAEQQLYGEFYCSECGISFHRQDLLRRHSKLHAKKAAAKDINNTTTAIAAAVNIKDAQHCCNTCGETFAEALDLLAHAEIHARFPPFKCVLCGEAFYEDQAIKRHLESRHAQEITVNSCILCGKECRDRKALMKHSWDHSREKCHSCSKCGKNFHNKARLKRHMASHRDKSVMCDVCQEEFPDGRSLSNHRHSHSATSSGKLFPCAECGKTFGSRSSQQIHVRIHTGERPYGCRFCWKAFADGGTLRKHERIHTGEKPYACSVCPRAFNQRVVLREHIRSHHSGKDVNRGTFFCTVCSADLTSSNELIQHLIQHSDMNTAKQRQPVTGPRKYKRRRKLQPHEIAHLRAEFKTENLGSDIDLSDFDMENVDDLLGITEAVTTTTSTTTTSKKSKGKSKTVATKRATNKSKSSVASIKSEVLHDDDDDDEEEQENVTISSNNNNNNKHNEKKTRYDSNNSQSDKLWDTKFLQNSTNNQEDTYKTFFSNVEQGLKVIDTLFTNTNATKNQAKPRRAKQGEIGGSQRTQEIQLNSEKSQENTTVTSSVTTNTASVTRSRKKSTKTQQKSSSARPRMIHTEKSRVIPDHETTGNAHRKTRARTYVTTRTEATKIDLLQSKSSSASTIVDDYEIISPATQPPNQISSSPLHIKQEHEQNQHHHHHHQQQQRQQQQQQNHNQLQNIYDAHLLLDASSLRKTGGYDKFNPSIVNDFEEIFRSPLKSERSTRQRFTSESSTTPQFLPDDEQHLIKIEPTSPDLREIVESQQRNITTSHSGGTSARTTQLRQITSNGKYLLDTATNVRGTTKRGKHTTTKQHKVNGLSMHNGRSSNTSGGGGGGSGSISNTTTNTQQPSTSASASYLNYGVDTYASTVAGTSSNSDVNSTYFSISEVVSAANATEAAAAAAASAKPERKMRQFECEMCSAVFSDRTQLLEHVHIHI